LQDSHHSQGTAVAVADDTPAPGKKLGLIRRRIAILPTLCTLCNAACGLGSLVFAAQLSLADSFERDTALYISGCLIFLAMIFDLFDGFLARRMKTASNFGAELDSLCDAISFGAAPAFMLLQLGTGSGFEDRRVKEVFLLVGMLYMICAILRLARFNVHTDVDAKSHRSFVGLPSPAAGACIAALVVLRYNFIDSRLLPDEILNPFLQWFAPAGAIFVALLMVSRVPYPHAANRILHRRFSFTRLVQIILAVFALVMFREFGVALAAWLYALLGPARLLLSRTGIVALPETPPQATK
jgi:CDP-diacylglycerol---serine O-phosphatidyltransferase